MWCAYPKRSRDILPDQRKAKIKSAHVHLFMHMVLTVLFVLLSLMTKVFLTYAEEISADLTKLDLKELMEIEVATVYTASKFEQKVTEAPSAVSIITSSEIKKYGYRNLADILRSVRGFYVTYDRNYHYLGVRGFARPGDYNTRFLLLVDGHKINNNIYDSAAIGTEFPIDVDLIDRVEVIPGPGSSLYGSNAFFGVINVITKQGADIDGFEVSGEAAGFGTYKGRGSYGTQLDNGLDILFSGSLYDSRGRERLYYSEFDRPETNNGIAVKADDDQFMSFFSKIKFQDFTLQGAFISREKGIPTASYNTVFNDSNTRTIDEQGYLDLKYEHDFDNQFNVVVRVFYDRFNFEGSYVCDYPPVTVNKDVSPGEWWGGEIKVNKNLFERHILTLGLEYQNNLKQELRNYDEEPYMQYLEDKRRSTNWAYYFQDEFTILNNLLLNAGIRYDHYDTFGGTTNPRIALIYNPLKTTFLKLLYGRAFRSPNVYELYYNDGGFSSKANLGLKPETIKTYEIILEQYFARQLKMTVSGFYYKINNLISLQTDPSDGLLVFINRDKVETKGVELELEKQWDNGITGRLSYTYQKAKDVKTNKMLTNSPRHLGKFNMILPLLKEKLFTGLEVQYTGKRKTIAGNNADDFLVANLTLFGQNLLKNMEFSASIYNLFDKKYKDPASSEHLQDTIEQDGRNVRFKLTYKF